MRKVVYPFLAIALDGCTVGPEYKGPAPLPSAAAPGSTFARTPLATSAQEPSLAQWWKALGDPVLDTLEARALADNPGVEAGRARIAQARQAVHFVRGEQYPTGAVQGTYVDADLPGLNFDQGAGSGSGSGSGSDSKHTEGTSIDFFNLGLNANWEVDIWGGKRRGVEAANAELGAAVANAADRQVQLTAEVAQAYVNLRERQHRIASLQRSATLQQEMLDLSEQRFRSGTTAAFEVERAKTQLNETQLDIASVEAEVDTYLNALAVLTGVAPGVADPLLVPVTPIPLPPASVAIGDPASLLRRRPDVRAAERKLAAATARIGVVEAARLPKVSFMGILGIGGTSPSQIFDLGNMSKIAIPQIQWGLLDFGRSLARLRQTRSARDEAEAQYRQTVLAALEDAETSLSRFGRQRQKVAALAGVSASADRTARLTRQRYRAGTVPLSDSLDAERQSVEAELALRVATAVLTGSFVAVQKSLGLGWQRPGELRINSPD